MVFIGDDNIGYEWFGEYNCFKQNIVKLRTNSRC